ncbi:SDR family NAD(P)-dependent oxidoreductase [Rhodococcus ruber]|uniref:SDR family NAD(P)-dependent oxidoreductase n=1 Tax=Rhodococcus ruber TaxID=1830 RepID=UPI000ECA96AD|nr:SDR family NAD(P)-dependent oxidoreductase [Rhodococcus ruber]MBP2212321.1 NAD(P)-dependent dehydrogenase (short-subunit alcohol dehydrogenase family) [Rhodococcus ruber]QRE81894.1 SDR family NAD(P)-dependent oxidoreductase [Rhodococcus ruber]RIK12212.1 MAG: short-chain dehydrogenase [Acidobacteriota bacterium]
MVEQRIWLVTGASRGLGRAFTREALAAGDRVAALARTATAAPEYRDDERVLTVDVDVTDRSAVFAAVERVVDHFGRLDVVVNNAGTMWTGFVEEFTEEQARAQMETNFFGALWVTQAVLPALRRRPPGRLLQISSVAGIAAFPTTGLYSASKFALEGLSEAVAAEAVHFGVAVTIVEPGGYWTDLYKDMPATAPLDDYAALRAELAATSDADGVDSEPALAAAAVRAVVDSDDPPRRLILGSVVYDAAVGLAQDRIRDWAAWEKVSRAAEHAVPAPPGYTT